MPPSTGRVMLSVMGGCCCGVVSTTKVSPSLLGGGPENAGMPMPGGSGSCLFSLQHSACVRACVCVCMYV